MTFNMLPALSSNAMREADRFTIEDIGIPGFTLMESAGRAAVHCIIDRYGSPKGKNIGCFCGKGNNGGDGFVVARQLATMGACVTVFLMSPPETLSKDAASGYSFLKRIADLDKTLNVSFQSVDDFLNQTPSLHFDLLIDGLLGTGVTSNLTAPYQQIVTWMNQQKAPTVALDLPTGLHADTGVILGNAIIADLTVTMGAIKTGLLMGDGPACAGEVQIAEIGIPPIAIRKSAALHGCAHVVTGDAVKTWLPVRAHTAHKYSVGMALVVAGAAGLTGAATLAATAAARSGAGAVICATPGEVQEILALKMTEVMTLALPSSEAGITPEAAITALEEPSSKAASLLVGCGMGKKPATQQFIRSFLSQSALPAVIDADGLNAFAGHTDLFASHAKGRWILTPHPGEFRQLAGKTIDMSDLLATARNFAMAWDCVLILKGAPTVVSDPEGRVFINPTHTALATAGAGDVLAGLCAGFLAQGLTPVQSALTALYLGREAASRYAQLHHPATMLASDLIDNFDLVVNTF